MRLNSKLYFVNKISPFLKHALLSVLERWAKYLYVLAALSVLYFAACRMNQVTVSYFSRFSLPAHVCNILLIGAAGYRLYRNEKTGNMAVTFGKMSFTVYLLHQFVAGAVVSLTGRFDFFLLTLARPFITAGITVTVAALLRKAAGKYCRVADMLIGMRG